MWHRRKPAALIKLLALAPGHRLHREEVMETLWPELDPETAGANLRKALYYARRALASIEPDGAGLITSDADLLTLTADRLLLDIERFRRALAAGRRGGRIDAYQQAVDCYRSGLL